MFIFTKLTVIFNKPLLMNELADVIMDSIVKSRSLDYIVVKKPALRSK